MPRKKRHLALILHGERAFAPEIRHLVEWVRAKGHTLAPRVTWEAGDATFLASELARSGVDTVIAGGGDGTVNEVLNGLSGLDVPMGIIPLGTANDFATQVGIPLDPDHAMDVILRRPPIRIDTAELNGRRFLNVSTGGIGAEATAETPAEAKRALGSLAYLITGLRKLATLAPRRARFDGDGLGIEIDFLVFAVGNAQVTGGGTAITPEADVRDGLLDVCIVESMPRMEFARLLPLIKRGEHLYEDGVHYHQVPRLQIEAADEISVNVDGESQSARTLRYASRRADLLIHLPRLPGAADTEE